MTLRGAGLEVAGGLGAGAEAARGLDHDVDAELRPRQLRGVALGGDDDPVAVDLDEAVVAADGAREAAVDGVVGEQVRERGGVGDVVDGDDLEIGAALEGGAQHAPSDAAEAIDADTSRHAVSLVDGGADARAARPADHRGLRGSASVALRSQDRVVLRMWDAPRRSRIAA